MKIIIKNTAITVLLGVVICWSCSDMNDLHDKYLKQGETIYVGQCDSVKIFSGRNRVKISYRNYDPKVARLKVYWDFRQDSATFDVPVDKRGEPVEIVVDGLAEKQYTFELVTSNSEGKYPSVPLDIPATVYGSKYEATLINRKVKVARLFALQEIVQIEWGSVLPNMVGVELYYYNIAGDKIERTIPNDETVTTLFDVAGDIKYRTAGQPEKTVIDLFYTEYAKVNAQSIVEQLDRTKFARWNPPGISYISLDEVNWKIEKLWDNVKGSDGYYGSAPNGYSFPASATLPRSFTFDLGKTVVLTNVKLFQRHLTDQLYIGSNVRKFQIWGSASPSVNQIAGDTGFDGWTRLGDFECYKPSGLPVGQKTQEDVDFALAGQDYPINNNIPVRYIRFHIIQTWGGTNAAQIWETQFFGYLQYSK